MDFSAIARYHRFFGDEQNDLIRQPPTGKEGQAALDDRVESFSLRVANEHRDG